MITPYLLSKGFSILLPNYRGSSGRGPTFASLSSPEPALHAYEDVITLTQHAVSLNLADPERLVIGGYSHGGFLTNICAMRNGTHGHGSPFKAAISGASISDGDAMASTSDLGNAYQGEICGYKLPWTVDLDDVSARKSSALYMFKEAMERKVEIPPMLLLHGANDERCPVSQSWGLRRALEHYKLPFEMVVYPRQGHVFHEREAWIDMAWRIGNWVEKYVGPAR